MKLLARHFGIPLKVATATGNDMIDAAQRIRQADTITYDLGCFGATILSSAARYNDVLVSGSGMGGAFRSSRWFHDARHLLQSRQYRLIGGFALLSRALLNREYATALHMLRRRAWKYPLPEIYSRYKINRFDDSVNCRDHLTPVLRGLDKYRDAEIFTVIDRVLVAELYLANKYRELSAQGRSTFLPYAEAPVREVFDRVARQNGGYDLLVGKGLAAMALEEERRKGLLAARKLALAVEIGPLLATMDEAGLLSTRRLQDAYRHLYRTRESLDQLYRRSGLDARKRQKVVYSPGLLNLWNKDAFEVALRHESPRVSDTP
ncbi:MAG: hypothetical protein M5U09_11555 [Gammaproteobacteria bacterium]|nr:hypothetical protein [Gammaproteobacteria bacterium]